MDQMVYGQTFLFDGTPVVEDVWIDLMVTMSRIACSNNCEWKRVVVVQQGKGGPLTLALDITDTMSPKYLWEQIDESDNTAIGYTTSRPVVGASTITLTVQIPKIAMWPSWVRVEPSPMRPMRPTTSPLRAMSTCGTWETITMEPKVRIPRHQQYGFSCR